MRRLARSPQSRGDDGVAIVAVVGVMVIVTLLAVVSLTYVMANLRPARADQDAKIALSAAQAGVDDYLARLNIDGQYWANGGVDPTNQALSSGRVVPGATGASATFSYRPLNTVADITASGVVHLRSTGRSGNVSRSLTVSLQQTGFIKFLYFTDVEATDPALYVTDPANSTDVKVNGSLGTGTITYRADAAAWAAACSAYYHGGRSSPRYTSSAAAPYYEKAGSLLTKITTPATVSGLPCKEIQFTGNDVIDGPVHTNDALQVNGAVWFKNPQTETSWADGATPAPAANHRWWGTSAPLQPGSGSPGYLPVYAAPLGLPVANSDILAQANPATSAPGCLYLGSTRIRFVGTQMKVYSPATTAVSAPLTPARCYNTAASNTEQTVDIPPVVYVQNATVCAGGDGTASRVGFPQSGEDLNQGATTTYNCALGDAFVEGTVNGQVTVAAANDVMVTGDLRYSGNGTGTDVTGLIANNYVWIYNPVTSSNTNLLSSSQQVHTVQAAILALNHSMLVQNWNRGSALSTAGDDASKLNILGAIAQKYRGPVGTGTGTSVSSGYLKNYRYDSRLLNLPPPYFLKPTLSSWRVTTTSDG